MNKSRTYIFIKKNGEYLGFDSSKGYIYSVFNGYDDKDHAIYTIYAISGGDVCILITYSVKE